MKSYVFIIGNAVSNNRFLVILDQRALICSVVDLNLARGRIVPNPSRYRAAWIDS
jgi:hypothetical protein